MLQTALEEGEAMISNEFGPWPSILLGIATDNNTHCMNYIMALAFVITSLLSPSLSVCELALCQLPSRFSKREGKGEKKRREMTVQGFQNQV